VVRERRGLFSLEPPAGGLERLRQDLRRSESEDRSLPLLPWATAALLLLALGSAVWLRTDPAALVVAEVRAQEVEPWTPLAGPAAGARIYVARPADQAR
jgi:hypothetical protein